MITLSMKPKPTIGIAAFTACRRSCQFVGGEKSSSRTRQAFGARVLLTSLLHSCRLFMRHTLRRGAAPPRRPAMAASERAPPIARLCEETEQGAATPLADDDEEASPEDFALEICRIATIGRKKNC